MSERYSKLFALSENLYSVGAPVVIAAGALQKDNQTGKVFAQLKIRNIQGKTIKAATVKITPFDTVWKPIGETVDYQYLDLSAGRDTDFGQKTPVMLQEAATRSFAVSVSEVIFSDNSVWTTSNEAWRPLSAPVTPEKEFQDGELAKQYRAKYGADCKCVFKKEKDLWRCACGALNRDSEKNCHSCQREAVALAALNVEELKAERDQRLAAEQKKATEEKAATAAQIKKIKRIAIIVIPLVILASIVAGISNHRHREANLVYLKTQEKTRDLYNETSTTTYTYNNQGDLAQIDYDSGRKILYTYSYDGNENLIQRESKSYDSSNEHTSTDTTKYEYDNAGNLIEERRRDYSVTHASAYEHTITYVYDEVGNCVKKFTWCSNDSGDAIVYTYNNGVVVEEIRYHNYGYDGKGEPDEDWYIAEDNLEDITVYTYDSAGHCIEKCKTNYVYTKNPTEVTVYTYEGDYCVEEIYTDSNESSKNYTKTMKYDEHGNCINEITNYEYGRLIRAYTYELIYAPRIKAAQEKTQQH